MPSKPHQIEQIAWIAWIASLVAAAACGPTDPSNGADTSQPNAAQPDDGPEQNNSDEPDMTPGRPSIPLRVATYNVGRLFDTVCDSNNCGDAEDFERQMSPAEFDFKIDQLGNALEKLDAEIVTLQEIENETCLDALVAERPEYDFAALGEIGGTASLDVGIIAKGLTHLETRTHRAVTELPNVNERFARELLEVHFDKQGERVIVFAAHFKAQRNDDPEWRLAEAQAARQIAEASQAEFPAAFVYLGGDLNDEPGTPPLDALTANGGLVSVTGDLPAADSWTYAFGQTRIVIDHILYVPSDNGAHALAEVVRDASGALGSSDHAALMAVLDIYTD